MYKYILKSTILRNLFRRSNYFLKMTFDCQLNILRGNDTRIAQRIKYKKHLLHRHHQSIKLHFVNNTLADTLEIILFFPYAIFFHLRNRERHRFGLLCNLFTYSK